MARAGRGGPALATAAIGSFVAGLLATLALALLARQRGDTRMAETYRQSAARVLARKAAP